MRQGSVIFTAIVSAHVAAQLPADRWSRRGGGPGVLGIGDEVFHPTRHEAQVELDRQTSLPAPAPVPGDGPLGLVDAPAEAPGYAGRLRIQVD